MDMCTRRLTKELKALQKDPIQDPRIIVAPNERNLLEMHYVIEGSKGTPFEGGVYHGKLIFPKEYPLKPPSVIMLTPSGRFQPGRRLCLSMSDFHPESWNPMYVLLAEGSASVPPADGSDWGTWRVCPSYAVDQLRATIVIACSSLLFLPRNLSHIFFSVSSEQVVRFDNPYGPLFLYD
jgi:ubiquitin-conjugating enzyme E2 J2